MANYDNYIQIGVKIDPQNLAQDRLNNIIEKLNSSKIKLDVEIKGDASKQLENLSILIDGLKSKIGKNISLNDFNKSIDNSINGLSKLNGEIQKNSQISYGDGSSTVITQVSNKIGEVITQTKKFDKNNNIIGEGIARTTVNLLEQEKALKNVTKARETLNNLSNVDKNKVQDLKNILGSINKDNLSGLSTNELKNYLNQVNELENKEKDNVLLANQMQDAWDKAYQQRITSEQKALSQIQENEKKAQEQEILRLGKQALAQQKAQQDLINQMANGRENSEIKTKEIDRSNELAQAKAINKSLEDSYKLEQEKQMIIQHQTELYRQISVMEQNGFLNNSDISKLKDMVASLEKMKDMHGAMNAIGDASNKESSIVSITKQLNDAQTKLDKLKQTFGNKLPNGFIESTETEINKLKDDLTKLDGNNFNNIRNSINQLNANIRETGNEAKNSTGILGSLGDALKNIGLYVDIGDVFRGLVNGAKDAVKYVVDVENSMIDLRRIVDMTDSQADGFQTSMHNVSEELATNNKDMISTVANFAKLGYSLEDATKLGEVTTKYNLAADINDINSSTTSLIATLKGFNLQADQAVRVTDEINQISNKYAVTAGDVNTALAKSSATLGTFGNSFEDSVALISSANEIMQNASTVGQALKSIAPRLTTNDNSLAQLAKFNIDIEDANGNLKSTYQIFKELAPQMAKLKGEDLAKASNDLFGKQNISTGLAIIQNAKQLDSMMDTLKKDSGNSVNQEFDRYLDSTSAKIAQLKESMGGLYTQFLNSDMTKGTVDGLNSFVLGLTNVISKLGAIPSIITTVVGALTIFNSKFRESMTTYQPSFITNWKKSFSGLSVELGNLGNRIQDNIQKVNEQGNSTLTAKAKLAGYQTQLGLVTVAEKACAIGAEVMGVAFNMALGLGIGLAIQAITSFIGRSDELKSKNQELISSLDTIGNDVAGIESLKEQFESLSQEIQKGGMSAEETKRKKQELSSVYNQLIQQVPELKSLIDDESSSYDNQVKAIQSVIDKKNEEKGIKAEQYIKDNNVTDSSVQKQLEDLSLLQQNLDVVQKNLDKTDLTEKQRKNSQDYATDLKTQIIDLKNSLSDIVKVQDTLNNLGIDNGISGDRLQSIKDTISAINLYQTANNNSSSTISDNSNKTDTNTEKIKANIEALQEQMDANDNMVDSEKEKASVIQEATDEYNKATQAIAQATGYINKINKNGVTPELGGKLAKTYSDMGDKVNNASQAVEYLNKKITEQQDLQEQAYAVMVGDDENFYKEKIANNSNYMSIYNDFLNSFVGDGQSAYNLDGNNYKTLNELKQGAMDSLGTAVDNWLQSFVGVSAEQYGIDFSNFKSFAEAKAGVLNKLQEQIKKVNAQLINEQSQEFGMSLAKNTMVTFNPSSDTSSLSNAIDANKSDIQKYKDELGKLNSAYEKVDTSFDEFQGKMQKGMAGNVSSFGGSGSGSSKGNSGKSDAEKNAEKAEKLTEEINKMKADFDIDPYYELNNALTNVNNELTHNKTLMESLTEGTPEYEKAQINQISLYQKQQDALQNLNSEQQNQANILKDYLNQYGFAFDEIGNLTNSQDQIKYWTDVTNAMTGSTEGDKAKKQEWIDWIKELQEKTKDYSDLVNDKIPSIANQFDEVANSIKSINDEMRKANLELVNNLRDELAQDIIKDAQEKVNKLKEEAKKAEEDSLKELEEEKEAVEKKYDARIKRLQDQLDALNDESDDTEKKLEALKKERALWQKDDSVFAEAKIKNLDTEIADLEKTIAKNNLQNQIDELTEKKKNESDSYDESIDAQKTANEKKESDNEKLYEDMINEQKAYAKADQLIQSNNQSEIIALLKKYDTSYKDVGNQLSSSLTDPFIEKIDKVEQAWNKLSNKITEVNGSPSDASNNSSSSSSSSWWGASKGDHVWLTNSQSTDLYGSAGNDYLGTTWDNGIGSADELKVVDYDNGWVQLANSSGKKLGWVDRYLLSKWNDTPTFATGGRTPDNLGSEGMPAILHSGEKILNQKDTSMIDRIDDFVTKSMGSINSVSSMIEKYNSMNPISSFENITSLLKGNEILNNNNDNKSITFENEINITNKTQNDSYFNAKNLDKMLKQQINRFK